MYKSERIFIKKFLASLVKLGVKEIPYDNNLFYQGVANMSSHFISVQDNLGQLKDEIGVLFARHAVDGIFSEFKSQIANQNGVLMSFENPDYVRATIKMDDNGISYILNNEDIDISNEIILDFANSFCKGAMLL